MSRGVLIALEGGEGAGKSTQARLLANAIEARGREVLLTREPGGTPGAEAIRQLLLDPPGQGWQPAAEALLFAAARSDHVARAIEPALKAGKWVICDRFVDSSRAYQGGAGRLGDDAIMALHRVGTGGLQPDLTVLIEVDASEAEARVAARDGVARDAIARRPAQYFDDVSAAFRRLADAEPDRYLVLAGGGSKEETHRQIITAVVPLLANS